MLASGIIFRKEKYGFLALKIFPSKIILPPRALIIWSGSKPMTEYIENFPSSPSDSKIKQLWEFLSIFWKRLKKSVFSRIWIYLGFCEILILGNFFILFYARQALVNSRTLVLAFSCPPS